MLAGLSTRTHVVKWAVWALTRVCHSAHGISLLNLGSSYADMKRGVFRILFST